MESEKKLYRFHEYFGRMGSLTGTFVATEAAVARIKGKEIYFGEVLGKHSEIVCEITDENLKVLTDDQDFIAKFEEYRLTSGHNPFDHFEEEEADSGAA